MPKPPPQTLPSLTIDWDAYLPYIEDADISDAQKRELIETLWSVVVTFVDLGFDLRNVDDPACGQNDDPLSDDPPDLVSLMGEEHLSDLASRIERVRQGHDPDA